MKGGGIVDNGYTKRIRERVLSLEDGTVFVTSDFADIADTSTIRQSLSRLVQSGTLRRILKGVYEKPKYSKLLDEYVAADPEAVANALARSYHWTIAPCGNALDGIRCLGALYLGNLHELFEFLRTLLQIQFLLAGFLVYGRNQAKNIRVPLLLPDRGIIEGSHSCTPFRFPLNDNIK